jgi:hypothetical protein
MPRVVFRDRETAPVAIGEVVYFYFLHAFCVPGTIDTHNAEPLTGRFEMRCRIAKITAVDPSPDPTGNPLLDDMDFATLPDGQVHLEVEFTEGDRIRVRGGSGCRPARVQKHVGAHRGPNGLGRIYKAWPEHRTWAFEAKAID